MRSPFIVLLSAAFLCTLAIGCSGTGDAEAMKVSKKPATKAKPSGASAPDAGPAPPIVRP